MYKKKTATKRPYKKRAYKRNYKKKTALVTKSQLYSAIRKNEETKIVCIEQAWAGYNSGISANTEMNNVMPPVPSGVTASDRIGDSIRPVKLVIRGVMSYNTEGISNANLIMSRLFLVQQKGIRDNNNKSGVSTNLLQFGATNRTFIGDLLDITRPQNTDLFTFFADRKHTFMKPLGLSNASTANSMSDVDKSLVKYFTITLTQKQLPAVLKYSGSSSTYPTNFLPLICLGYAYASNYSPDTASTQIGMSYTSTLYYKDA